MDRSLYTAEEGPLESSRRPDTGRRNRTEDRQVRRAVQSVLENAIVPRLMNAHRSPLSAPPSMMGEAAASSGRQLDVAHVNALVEISLRGEADQTRAFVMRLKDEGVSIESLYLDLITPAARKIGVMWEADTCDFVLVTLALLRIQQVAYDLSPEFLEHGVEPSSRRVMISPVPGSHHTLGAAMVADFFRRDGWDVFSSHDLSRAELLRLVRKEWFDVVALSISAPNQLVLITALISDIRKVSVNKGILVMVGGPLAQSVPDLATRVGADAVTLDAKEAVDVAGQAVPVRRASVAN